MAPMALINTSVEPLSSDIVDSDIVNPMVTPEYMVHTKNKRMA